MALLPQSPRRRRRLVWGTAALAAIVAVGLAIGLMPRGERLAESDVATDTGPRAEALPPLQITPARRREIDRLVHRFTETAVTRRDPAAAWELASASMHSGVPRDAWNRGELPGVLPFDATAIEDVSWKVVYRAPERVGIDVLVVAKPGSGQQTIVYQTDLVQEDGRLLVAAWAPQATLGGGTAPPPAAAAAPEQVESRYSRGRLDARWLLVPAGIVLLLLGTAVVLLVRHAIRSRRAYRRYRGHAGV
jgi:hypothetical protein